MSKQIFLLTLCVLALATVAAQQRPRTGMVISRSVKLKAGVYTVGAPDSLAQGAITIRGNNITVDFAGVLLRGSARGVSPDSFRGVAVYIAGGRNIRLKNLQARGYKVAVLARDVEGLLIENCDLGYNYRQRLNSTQEVEDFSDWLSHHRNDADEWLRYGAAIYLKNCRNAIVAGNRVTGGQNALLLTACNGGMVYNNDFSFNSGLGIGLYRSSGNRFLHNRLNFNVRGYSHGVFSRGQDSAGFLVYEQSSDNVFFKNSATHSGDGFFLWAGQSTMESGQGGCNDNTVLENDFSYAPTNGVEVTFSRNRILNNRIVECDHGIWGGYSFQSAFNNNQLLNNRIGIAIEHGQQNEIVGNVFAGNKEAIRLWARAVQPTDWGYAKTRDTRSVGYRIALNNFSRNGQVYTLQRTDSLAIFDNVYSQNSRRYNADLSAISIDSIGREIYDTLTVDYSLKEGMDPFQGNGRRAGRKNIRITEWGPYNFKYPLLWLSNPVDTGGRWRFEVLGPAGQWRLLSVKGLNKPDTSRGGFPGELQFAKPLAEAQDIAIVAEYRGPAFIDAFGERHAANKPYRFYFRKFYQPLPFTLQYHAIDSVGQLWSAAGLAQSLSTKPFKTDTARELRYAWWDGITADSVHHRRFVTVSNAAATVKPGSYELRITWQGAVRVYVDDRLVLDQWAPNTATYDEAQNRRVRLPLGGHHRIRVQHAALGGFSALRLVLHKP